MQDQITALWNAIRAISRKTYQQDIQNGEVKQRHIEALIIFRGTLAKRPTDGNTQIQAYYAEDQKKMYIWNRTNKTWEAGSFT